MTDGAPTNTRLYIKSAHEHHISGAITSYFHEKKNICCYRARSHAYWLRQVQVDLLSQEREEVGIAQGAVRCSAVGKDLPHGDAKAPHIAGLAELELEHGLGRHPLGQRQAWEEITRSEKYLFYGGELLFNHKANP